MIDFWRKRIDFVLIFVICFVVAAYWQSTSTIGDPDGFYHAKMALMLSQGRFLTQMPWMYFTVLRTSFTDHHFLYHVFLIPFVVFSNPLLGVKLATVYFSAALYTVLYWFLKHFKVWLPALFVALLLTASSFTFRISLVKANSLSLIVILFILYALFERRRTLLFVLSAVYVWLYGGWLSVIMITVIYTVISVFMQYIQEKKQRFIARLFHKPDIQKLRGEAVTLLATGGGALFGIIVNPYWPRNIQFYKTQIWQIAILNKGGSLNVGGEWSGLSLFHDVNSFYWFIIPSFIVACICLVWYRRSLSVRSWTLFVITIVTILFTIRSRRYIELSAPFSLLFVAFVLSESVSLKIFAQLKEWVRKSKVRIREPKKLLLTSLILIVLIVPLSMFPREVTRVRNQLAHGIPLERYAGVGNWLRMHAEPQSIVVHSDWDDWPMLWYANDRNYYIVGLDPRFMYDYDRALYERWASMTRDGRADDVVDLVVDKLKARYVVIEKDHSAMRNLFKDNVYFQQVYEDKEVWLYTYRDPHKNI